MAQRSYEDICEELVQRRDENFALRNEVNKLKAELDDLCHTNAVILRENKALIKALVLMHEENGKLDNERRD